MSVRYFFPCLQTRTSLLCSSLASSTRPCLFISFTYSSLLLSFGSDSRNDLLSRPVLRSSVAHTECAIITIRTHTYAFKRESIDTKLAETKNENGKKHAKNSESGGK